MLNNICFDDGRRDIVSIYPQNWVTFIEDRKYWAITFFEATNFQIIENI